MPDEVREHLTRYQRSFLHPESLQILQIHSSMMVLLLFRENLTRDQRSFLHPESLQILQIPSFFSSVHFTRVLQGSDQRTPDKISEIIPSSRITPDPSDSQLHDGASSLQFTSLVFYRVQIREHLTRDQRSFLHPESLQTLQIHSFSSSVHFTRVLQGSGHWNGQQKLGFLLSDPFLCCF